MVQTSGFIYQLYGFGTVLELELLQEAGFHPLRSYTGCHNAWRLRTVFYPKKQPIEYGVVRPGLLADMIIVDENPPCQYESTLRYWCGEAQ